MAKKANKRTSLVNSRFCNAAEIIVKKNRAGGYKPDSIRSLSVLITGDPTSLSKIQRGERSATPQQIGTLGNKFNLDFNFFFRNQPVKYEVYTNKMFRAEKKGELLTRMIERFPLEIKRMEETIYAFNEAIKSLEKQKGDPATIRMAKKALAYGKVKLIESLEEM